MTVGWPAGSQAELKLRNVLWAASLERDLNFFKKRAAWKLWQILNQGLSTVM